MTPEESTLIKTVSDDVAADVLLGKKLVAAFKTGGKTALLAALPEAVVVLRKDYEDVKLALPVIKAGYKTTEFWLTAGIVLINGIYTAITGKTLPLDLNVVLGGVIAIYTAVRGLVKKPA